MYRRWLLARFGACSSLLLLPSSLLVPPNPVAAQSVLQAQSADSLDPPGPRRVAVSGGIGNHYGGVGGQVEVYTLHERASLLIGAGYATGPVTGGGVTIALAVRGYLPGQRHRVYGSLGFAPIAVQQEWTAETIDVGLAAFHLSDPDFQYGPTISAGYQYTARRGFTAQAGAGAGFAAREVFFVLDVGAGYTFGR